MNDQKFYQKFSFMIIILYRYILEIMAALQVSDVKRVWSLRQALLLIDFEDSSSECLKQLLHQCMINRMYLKLEEVSRINNAAVSYTSLMLNSVINDVNLYNLPNRRRFSVFSKNIMHA